MGFGAFGHGCTVSGLGLNVVIRDIESGMVEVWSMGSSK